MHYFKRTSPDDTKNDKNGPADKLITHKWMQMSLNESTGNNLFCRPGDASMVVLK